MAALGEKSLDAESESAGILGKRRKWPMVQQLSTAWFTSFKSTECSAVIAACGCEQRLWSQALQDLNLMQEQILIPDVVTYTTCLVACARSKEAQRALLLFEDMPKFAVRPSEVTFGAAIQACATCSCWQRGLELVAAVPQNSFAATSAISACGAGRWPLALAILEDLGELKGSHRVAVNACITACAKSSEWATALSLLARMASWLALPDVVSYSAAISACEKAGMWTAALALYASMMSSRTQIDVVGFGALISACEKAAQWQLAVLLLQRALESTMVVPNLILFNEKAGEWKCAMLVFDTLQLYALLPDTISFNAVLSAMEKTQKWMQAVCLLKQSGIAADVISNNAVLSASGGAGRWRQALFVLCQTMALQLVPDLITYSAGVSACAKAKQWAGSLLLLQQLREAGGGAAEEIAYNAAVSSCEDTWQWKESLELLAAMRCDDLKPNVLNLNVVIGACCKASELRPLQQLLGSVRSARTLELESLQRITPTFFRATLISIDWLGGDGLQLPLLIAWTAGAATALLLTRLIPRSHSQPEPAVRAEQAAGLARGALDTGAKGKRAEGPAPSSNDGMKTPKREVVCADALPWIRDVGTFSSDSMILTSLPDVSEVVEFAPRFEDWEAFFLDAVRSILEALPSGGVAVFYQTDIRLAGIGQVSKSYLVLHAASQVSGVRLKWHKIVHFGTVDQPTWNAIQFTHLLCFARTLGLPRVGVTTETDPVVDLGSTLPDILERGSKPPGLRKGACCMGIHATASVLKWVVRRLPGVRKVIDPFCGAGTVLAIANEYGLDALGIDISPKRIKQAKQLDGAALLGSQEPCVLLKPVLSKRKQPVMESAMAGLHPLYSQQSMLTFEGEQFQGADAICQKIVSLPFQKVQHQIVKCDCQPSANDGVVIFITGNLLVDDNANPLKFAQVFQLMKGPTGNYYCHNDMFRLNIG
ncbi:unnamed protein product [Symbiodinium sp. KB8]|nr:unnamed protein product [Symbiodinium sp. KB8]